MPIRQSDDYLTARAANPRTGLISPSAAGTPAPRTPDSPGHALKSSKLSTEISPSPPQFKQIPARKLCGIGSKSAQAVMWLHDGNSWSQDTRALKMASPVLSGPGSEADLLDASSHPGFSDDQFVVKMPSGREPQPYKYGSSQAQMRALEYYKHKAKRTSVEGYDPRLIEMYKDDPELSPPRPRPDLQRMPNNRGRPPMLAPVDRPQPQQCLLPKQRSRVMHNDASAFRELVDHGATIMPGSRNPSNETTVTTIRHPSQQAVNNLESNLGSATTSPPIVMQQDLRRTSDESTASTATVVTARPLANLGQLPRVRLVHPSLAAQTPGVSTSRKCSLGCERSSDDSACIGVRPKQTPIMEPSLRAMLQDAVEQPDSKDNPSIVHFAESVAIAFTILWQVLQGGLASHEQALHRLFPRDLTLWEKLMIVKSLVLLMVKATAIFLVIAVMWKVADVALQLLRFLLLPLRFLLGMNR